MRVLLITAFIIPLAACNSGGPTVSATNASMGEVQDKVAAAAASGDMISPGRWEGSVKMIDMKMAGLPPAAQAQIKGRLGEGRAFASCVTPEQIKQKRGLFTGPADDKSCIYDRFTMGGGKIDAAMTCNRGPAKMAATMTGSYSPDRYEMAMTSTTGGRPNPAMSMSMTIAAKRVGACTGTEDQAK